MQSGLGRALSIAAIVAAFLLTPGRPNAAEGDITLLGQLPLPGTTFVTDVWGWVDPQTDEEYAVVGDWFSGVYIVNVTNPAVPYLASSVSGVPGFDVKVWGNYVYTCDGNSSGVDSRIIDITNPNLPLVSLNSFASCHNIAISPGGLMFLEFPGLAIYDLNPDATNPTFLWSDPGGGHDSTPKGNVLYDFRANNGTYIWDITNPSAPVGLDTITDPDINYHHSGDVTVDGNYLFICDELASHPEKDITIWDISGPEPPFEVASITDASATMHNLYIVDNLAYLSFYTSGFKVYDVTDPTTPVLTDEYDTNAQTGEGYEGAFGVYPYAPGGKVYVSDIDNGLFIFHVENTISTPSGVGDTPAPNVASASLRPNYPNPFNPSTTIPYELGAAGHVRITVYDVGGARVRTLVDRAQEAGAHEIEWDGRDDGGGQVSSGVYFYRLTTAGNTSTRQMVLVK